MFNFWLIFKGSIWSGLMLFTILLVYKQAYQHHQYLALVIFWFSPVVSLRYCIRFERLNLVESEHSNRAVWINNICQCYTWAVACFVFILLFKNTCKVSSVVALCKGRLQDFLGEIQRGLYEVVKGCYPSLRGFAVASSGRNTPN